MASSKTQEAYAAIKQMLITSELAPNSTVSEEYLQAKLEMSRTPVREALQILTRERFLEVIPRKSIVVTDITLDLLNEIYDFREVNEPYIAQSACGKLPELIWKDLRNKFCNPPTDDPEAKRQYLISLDTLLHATIMQCCPNRFITDSMRIVLDHDARIKHFSYEESQNDAISIPEHLNIIDSILQNDTEMIRKSVLTHIQNSRRLVGSRVLSKFIENDTASNIVK